MRSKSLMFSCFMALLISSAKVLASDYDSSKKARQITTIVIHTIGGPACIAGKVQFRLIPERNDDAAYWGAILKKQHSAHFVIGRSGEKVDVVPLSQAANHTVGLNRNSVGIELVHRGDGKEPFIELQILKLIDLIRELRRTNPSITIDNIVMHSEIDQRTCFCERQDYKRRQDPGANFPLQRVLKEVKSPKEQEIRSVVLPRLTGEAPANACVTSKN